MTNVPADQIQTAISVVAASNPERARLISAHMERTTALLNQHQQAEAARQQAVAQQQQQQAQQLQSWIAQQDSIFEKEVAAKETPQRMQEIGQNIVELAQEYGVSRDELVSVWKSQPVLRSAAFQRIMVDAAKYRMSQREIAEKKFTPLPPVNRPGVSRPQTDDASVRAAAQQFRTDSSISNAVRLLQARRNAR